MRLTWQLIKKIKKGRIILLTTHSMDEADELGDRIAIMANGSLKCCGRFVLLNNIYSIVTNSSVIIILIFIGNSFCYSLENFVF